MHKCQLFVDGVLKKRNVSAFFKSRRFMLHMFTPFTTPKPAGRYLNRQKCNLKSKCPLLIKTLELACLLCQSNQLFSDVGKRSLRYISQPLCPEKYDSYIQNIF